MQPVLSRETARHRTGSRMRCKSGGRAEGVRFRQGQPDRPLVGREGRCSGGVGKFGRERALHLIDDQAWDADQSLDEDDARVDGADLFAQLSLAVRGDLSAEHDQDRS
jgi:hypothetical protein